MELSNYEIKQLSQAISYAIMYAKTESETAEFATLKVKVEGEIIRREEAFNRLETIDDKNKRIESLIKEIDSIKAKADKLAFWVENYLTGDKKTDFGDLAEALSEYKGGDNV